MENNQNQEMVNLVVKKVDEYIVAKNLHVKKLPHEESNNVPPQQVYEGIFGGFEGVYSRFDFRIVVRVDDVQVFMYLPATASKQKDKMAEFITRANYGMILGKFEMDYEDGEIRFQYAQPSSAILHDSTDASLDAIFFLAPSMMMRYAPGMAKVLSQENTDLTKLVRDCETLKDSGDGV